MGSSQASCLNYFISKRGRFIIRKSNKVSRKSAAVIFVLLVILLLIKVNNVTLTLSQKNNKIIQEANPEKTKVIKKEKEKRISERIEEIIDVNYVEMWNDYSDEKYTGKHIRVAAKIDHVSKSHIIVRENLLGLTGVLYLRFPERNIHQLESLLEGDYIIVTGKPSGKIVGQISLREANIEAVGDKALELANKLLLQY